MNKLWKSFLFASFVFAAGCSTPVGPAELETKKVSSVRAAFKVLETAGIEEKTTAKELNGQRVSSFNTKLFNMGFTSVKANLTNDVFISLGDSPAAQKIKEAGVSVFAYLTPRYTMTRENAKTGSVYNSKRRIILPDGVGSFCYGYYVILSPENDYQRSWTVTNTAELASSSTGMNAGIWGSSLGAKEWRALDIADETKRRAKAAPRPFYYDHGSRLLENCWADAATKAAWQAAR